MLLQKILGSYDSGDESRRNIPAACLQAAMGVIFLSGTDYRGEGKSLQWGKFLRALAHKENVANQALWLKTKSACAGEEGRLGP